MVYLQGQGILSETPGVGGGGGTSLYKPYRYSQLSPCEHPDNTDSS